MGAHASPEGRARQMLRVRARLEVTAFEHRCPWVSLSPEKGLPSTLRVVQSAAADPHCRAQLTHKPRRDPSEALKGLTRSSECSTHPQRARARDSFFTGQEHGKAANASLRRHEPV